MFLKQGGNEYSEHNYGKGATLEDLNQSPTSGVPQELEDLGLYRSNAWVSIEDKILLDWEV